MAKKEEPDVSGFLRELGELSTRYGVTIGGCGCCGSPFLMGPDGDLPYENVSATTSCGVTAYSYNPS